MLNNHLLLLIGCLNVFVHCSNGVNSVVRNSGEESLSRHLGRYSDLNHPAFGESRAAKKRKVEDRSGGHLKADEADTASMSKALKKMKLNDMSSASSKTSKIAHGSSRYPDHSGINGGLIEHWEGGEHFFTPPPLVFRES